MHRVLAKQGVAPIAGLSVLFRRVQRCIVALLDELCGFARCGLRVARGRRILRVHEMARALTENVVDIHGAPRSFRAISGVLGLDQSRLPICQPLQDVLVIEKYLENSWRKQGQEGVDPGIAALLARHAVANLVATHPLVGLLEVAGRLSPLSSSLRHA